MTRYCLLVVLVMLLQKGICICASGTIDNCFHQSCPDYKPFCTPIGCVVSCPTNDFVNGSTCVTSCDHMFVGKNRQCLDECPSDHLIKEEPVHNGGNYRIDRYCIDSCDQVIYNRTCILVCPKHAMYVNDGHCVVKCPPDKNIVRRFPQDKGHLRCSEDCGAGVFQDDICVANCSSYHYVFNQTCVKECPKEAPLLLSDNGRETCRSECPIYNQNGTCVNCCPEFIYNNSCVSECPDDEPFSIRPYLAYCWTSLDYREIKDCVPKCPDGMFISGKYCDPECPSNTRTVLDQVCNAPCSEEYPIAVQRQTSKWPHKTFFNCESRCPDVDKCLCSSDRPFLFNDSCVSECPPDGSFFKQRNFTIVCVPACDADEFVYNNTCLKTCPVPSYRYNNSCVDHCPTKYALDLYTANAGHDMCVDVCEWYVFNDTNCVERCPRSHQYKSNKTCLESCGTRYVDTSRLTCYDQCPSDRYLFNKSECISQCPPSHNYIYNGACVDIPCYTTYSLVHRQTPNVQCVGVCPYHTYILNSQTCVDKCPHVNFKSKCYDVCPSEASFLELGINCKESCSQYVLNKTCVSDCPKDERFLHNKRCVKKCPPGTLIDSLTHCSDKCPSDKVNKNGTCIFNYDCDDPNIIFNDECLVECPEHYVWLDTCINTVVVYILMTLCWAVLLGLIIVQRNQSRNFIQLITYSFSYRKTETFDDPRNFSGRRQTRESRVNFNENDDDVPLLQLDDTATHTENVDAIPGKEVCVEGVNTRDDEPLLQLSEISET